MADATATFAVELEDGVSGAAQSAEAALEELRAKIIEDTAALRQMEAAMRQMKASGTASAGAMSELADKIAAQKASLGQAQSRYVSMGGTFARVTGQANATTSAMGGTIDATNALGGRVGELAGKFKALKAAGPAAIAVVAVAAFVLLAAAITAVIVKMTAFAIKTADAARSVGLLREAATGSAAGAKELGAAVDRVAKKAALTREAIGGIALELARAGFAGAALENALASIAVVSSTMGDAAGAKLKSTILEATKEGKFALKDMAAAFKGAGVELGDVTRALADNLQISMAEAAARLKDGKVTLEQGLDAVARAVDKKLGGVAKKQLLALPNQLQRARENFAKLFSDIRIEPFLKALDSVLSLLDESTSSGKALKAIMTTMLQPIIDGVGRAAPLVKGFFKGMVIAALIFAIAVMKVKNALKEAFGDDAFEGIDAMKVAVNLGIAAFAVLAGIVVAVGAVLGVLGAGFLVVVGNIMAGTEAVGSIGAAFSAAIGAIGALAASAVAAGSNFVAGIAAGIKAGAKAVIAAVSSLAGEALSAFKAKFAISSPSRVMMKMGGHITEGLAEGVDDGAPDAERAMQGLMSIPTESATKDAPGGKASGGGVTISFGPGSIVVNGAMSSETDEDLMQRLARLLELAVRQAGMVPA